jgi:hypothetical protein
MKRRNLRLACSLALVLALPFTGFSKGYSSGGGRSYSSHSSSSHSFSSGSSRSSGGGYSRSSGSGYGSSRSSGSKTFSSGSGKSYSSGSSAPGDRKGYSSGKSYSSGSGSSSSSPGKDYGFDQSAARARKQEGSRSDYSSYKDSQRPPVIPRTSSGNYSGRSSTYTRTYAPDYTVIRSRPSRINVYFGPYAYRPWVYYHDPYSSLFWWWLLDRSIDEQAYWAYHHRYDMDPARYDALMASNQQLQTRVSQLEAQQVARDPSYTPPSLSTNQDLMYSDQYVNQAYQSYQNRPTGTGRAAFWVFGVPVIIGASVFFVWFVFFKRW